jgi:hypothetical protein
MERYTLERNNTLRKMNEKFPLEDDQKNIDFPIEEKRSVEDELISGLRSELGALYRLYLKGDYNLTPEIKYQILSFAISDKTFLLRLQLTMMQSKYKVLGSRLYQEINGIKSIEEIEQFFPVEENKKPIAVKSIQECINRNVDGIKRAIDILENH